MKRVILLFSLLPLLLISVRAQDQDEDLVLPDAVMQQVVSRIVTFYFKPRKSPTTIYFSDRGIKPEWLPRIRNIRFDLVKYDGHPIGYKGYVFSSLERAGKFYTIGFGYGDLDCNGISGKMWSFSVKGKKIRLQPQQGLWAESCDQAAAVNGPLSLLQRP